MNDGQVVRNILRSLRATWRDTRLLFREFSHPLLLFTCAVIGSGFVYFQLARIAGEPLDSLSESIYHTLNLTFLQASGKFPHAWYLQIFFFLMPLVGIGILALGLADFGVLFFNRRARGKEWQMAVASTFNNHIVLVGLGHLGYRVVRQLFEIHEDVVVIEIDPKKDLIEKVQEMAIPIIQDDASRDMILQAAGIARAHSIVLCTQNDILNLQVALKARSINPSIKVIVRIFDDDFAKSLADQFGFRALSATGIAAPIFAASAADADITPPITIEGQSNSLARLQVKKGSSLAGKTIQSVEETFELSVVMLSHQKQNIFHPHGQEKISVLDQMAVFGNPENINQLVHENHR